MITLNITKQQALELQYSLHKFRQLINESHNRGFLTDSEREGLLLDVATHEQVLKGATDNTQLPKAG